MSLAKTFAETITKSRLRGPLVLALEGELGAGKTSFLKGLAKGLGLKQKITSPTFLIARKYRLPRKIKNFSYFYHVDAYRITGGRDLAVTGVNRALGDPRAIVAIEWANMVKKHLPKNSIRIRIEHRSKNERTFSFS